MGEALAVESSSARPVQIIFGESILAVVKLLAGNRPNEATRRMTSSIRSRGRMRGMDQWMIRLSADLPDLDHKNFYLGRRVADDGTWQREGPPRLVR